MLSRFALNFQSFCLCFNSPGYTGMRHHAWLSCDFSKMQSNQCYQKDIYLYSRGRCSQKICIPDDIRHSVGDDTCSGISYENHCSRYRRALGLDISPRQCMGIFCLLTALLCFVVVPLLSHLGHSRGLISWQHYKEGCECPAFY